MELCVRGWIPQPAPSGSLAGLNHGQAAIQLHQGPAKFPQAGIRVKDLTDAAGGAYRTVQTALELADAPKQITVHAFADDELADPCGALFDSRKHHVHGLQILLELRHVETFQHVDLFFEREFSTRSEER